MIVEVEVDTLEQLDQVLPAGPDIVLLDNMSVEQLREAVARRNKINPDVELEASGGVTLSNVQADCRNRNRTDQRRRTYPFGKCPGFWAGLAEIEPLAVARRLPPNS